MKKQKKTKAAAPKKAAPAAAPSSKPTVGRREAMTRLRDYGLIGLLAVAVGWWLITDVQAHRYEHDLSRVGTGAPAIVQIHDPNCPLCRELQREARAALQAIDNDTLDYVVADIATREGRAFAGRYSVPHVTLMFFDSDGEVKNVLNGVRNRSELEAAFRDHLNDHSGS